MFSLTPGVTRHLRCKSPIPRSRVMSVEIVETSLMSWNLLNVSCGLYLSLFMQERRERLMFRRRGFIVVEKWLKRRLWIRKEIDSDLKQHYMRARSLRHSSSNLSRCFLPFLMFRHVSAVDSRALEPIQMTFVSPGKTPYHSAKILQHHDKLLLRCVHAPLLPHVQREKKLHFFLYLAEKSLVCAHVLAWT